MFGFCVPQPKYLGAAQPAPTPASPFGVFEFLSGFLRPPVANYKGQNQPTQAPGLLCGFLSPAQPQYRQSTPKPGVKQPDDTRHRGSHGDDKTK